MNEEVQRYEWSVSGGMYPVESGDYVKYSDYQKLKELVNKQADALAKNCAKLILEAEKYIEEHTKKEEDGADWWKK